MAQFGFILFRCFPFIIAGASLALQAAHNPGVSPAVAGFGVLERTRPELHSGTGLLASVILAEGVWEGGQELVTWNECCLQAVWDR